MAIDRDYWKTLHFKEGATPHWLCPRCNRGALVEKNGSTHVAKAAESREYAAEEGYNPEYDSDTFSSLMICGNPDCEEAVAVVGSVFRDGDHRRRRKAHLFYPRYFFPPMRFFLIHEKCPKVIEEELTRAFALFWTDQSGSMNHTRTAMELLLTDYGIKRFKLVGKGPKQERRFFSLHERVTELRKEPSQGELADRIEAIKWLGNAGSHPGTLSMDDVLDAFELVEDVIAKHYGRRDQSISKIAREINRRKKPRLRK